MSAAPASTGLRPPSEDEAVEKGAESSWKLVHDEKMRPDTTFKRASRGRADSLRCKAAGAGAPTARPQRHRIGSPSPSRRGILAGYWRDPLAHRLTGLNIPRDSAARSSHRTILTMATLRTVCRAPLRQLCPRSLFAIATNHPRAPPRQWRAYASSADAQHKVRLAATA